MPAVYAKEEEAETLIIRLADLCERMSVRMQCSRDVTWKSKF